MRNIDRLRAMSLEEIATYLVHRTISINQKFGVVLVDIRLAIKMLRLRIVIIG